MSGLFTSDFWDYLLPQLSNSEPAIRHAMAAVAAVHQQFVHTDRENKIIVDNSFVLQQYNKSIQQLVKDRSSLDSNQDLTLIICCLFICLEILRGNNSEALNHLEAGLKILCGHGKVLISQKRPKLIADSSKVELELSHLFSRLNIQMSFWGRPLYPFEPTDILDPNDPLRRFVMFSTIQDARHALNIIMAKALRFIRRTEGKCNSDEFIEEKMAHRRDLDDWLIAFENMMQHPVKHVKTLDPRVPLILKIHHRISIIWLETCIINDIMSFDNHWDDFEAVISFASEVTVYNSKLEDDPSSKFSLEMEIFPPVYFAAVTCRHPLLRRRAIDILSTYRRQECAWEPRERTKVAQLVLQIEEARLTSLPVEQRIPEARDRIYEAVSTEETPLNPTLIILLSKPDGPDSEWHSERHIVHW